MELRRSSVPQSFLAAFFFVLSLFACGSWDGLPIAMMEGGHNQESVCVCACVCVCVVCVRVEAGVGFGFKLTRPIPFRPPRLTVPFVADLGLKDGEEVVSVEVPNALGMLLRGESPFALHTPEGDVVPASEAGTVGQLTRGVILPWSGPN